MLKATDGIDENFLDTVSPLIGLEDVLRMAEVFFPKEGVFRIGPSFPLDFVAYSVFIPVSDLALLVTNNVLNFVFFFAIYKVRRRLWVQWSMRIRFMAWR